MKQLAWLTIGLVAASPPWSPKVALGMEWSLGERLEALRGRALWGEVTLGVDAGLGGTWCGHFSLYRGSFDPTRWSHGALAET